MIIYFFIPFLLIMRTHLVVDVFPMASIHRRYACAFVLLFYLQTVFAFPIHRPSYPSDWRLTAIPTKEIKPGWIFVHLPLPDYLRDRCHMKNLPILSEKQDTFSHDNDNDNHPFKPCKDNIPCPHKGPLGCPPPTPRHQYQNESPDIPLHQQEHRVACRSHGLYDAFIKNGTKPKGYDVISPTPLLALSGDDDIDCSLAVNVNGRHSIERPPASVMILLAMMWLAILVIGVIKNVELVWGRWVANDGLESEGFGGYGRGKKVDLGKV